MLYLWSFVLYIVLLLCNNTNGDVVGKLTVGYQGWFSAKGDGSPRNSWVHWGGPIPSHGHQTFELWPDVREYNHTYQTGYASLGNGEPAKLFSSFDDQVVNTHFKWMEQNGIDVAALQRFGSHLKSDQTNKKQLDGMALKVKNGAELHNRKFYVMYDLSGWTNFHTEVKEDWKETIINKLNLTSSSAYAKQNGKPVVCIWGIGFKGRADTPEQVSDLINFLKAEGLYVIGGVPTHWRTGADANPNFLNVFTSLNMLSPWSVGRFKGVEGAANYHADLDADFKLCNTHHVDYQPVLYPGFAWSNWNGGTPNMIPRLHGDFMWQQFVNIRTIGINNSYVAMFDEYDEGTAIAKAAESKAMIPTDQYFLTLDADGVHVSSDFYLRLVGDGARMMKGEIPLQTTHPTKHTL